MNQFVINMITLMIDFHTLIIINCIPLYFLELYVSPMTLNQNFDSGVISPTGQHKVGEVWELVCIRSLNNYSCKAFIACSRHNKD